MKELNEGRTRKGDSRRPLRAHSAPLLFIFHWMLQNPYFPFFRVWMPGVPVFQILKKYNLLT